MVWSPLSPLHFPPVLAFLAHTVCLKTTISVFSQHEISPIKPSVLSRWGPRQLCTNREKNCHLWKWEECPFWDGASTVLAEELNNVAHVCVGIAVKQEIALEKKENKLWGTCFPGWILLPETFHYHKVGKIGRKVLLIQCFKTQWKSQIV